MFSLLKIVGWYVLYVHYKIKILIAHNNNNNSNNNNNLILIMRKLTWEYDQMCNKAFP